MLLKKTQEKMGGWTKIKGGCPFYLGNCKCKAMQESESFACIFQRECLNEEGEDKKRE